MWLLHKHNKKLLVFTLDDSVLLFQAVHSNHTGTGPKTDSNWFSPNFINLVLLTFVDILTEQQSTGEGCKCCFDEDLIKSGEPIKLWVKL